MTIMGKRDRSYENDQYETTNQNQQQNTQDQTLTCIEPNCKQDFVFTAGEQSFYASRGFTPPKRCKSCREAKKARQESGDNRQRRAR